MRLLITRPEPDATHMKERLAELGHTAILAPIITIKFSRTQIPLNGIQAIVTTSRNALRALARSPSLAKAVDIPIFTVGTGSGAMASELGFERIVSGPSSARDLVPLIAARGEPSGRPLLILRGDHQAFDMKAAVERLGFSAIEKIVYRAIAAVALPDDVAGEIQRGAIDGVILMSPRTAEVFVTLAEAAGLDKDIRLLHYFCLSSAIAKRLGSIAPSSCHVAANSTSEDLLALITGLAAKSH
jgi:uroporphyrinogen-III synthase